MRRLFLALAALVVIAIFLWGGDRLLSRPDRIAWGIARGNLLTVQDALLHFEYDHGYLPLSLDALSPAYLRPDQLHHGGRPIYRYDREARTFARREPLPIHGLYRRTRPLPAMALPPPDPQVKQGVHTLAESAGKLRVPTGAALPPPPEGARVFEAEWYSDMNYGWEIRPDPTASGGASIHSKEGMGNGPGQTAHQIYNFYDIEESRDFSYLKYHFRLPAGGIYYLYGRMWTTGSHCSNQVNVGIDTGGPIRGQVSEYRGEFMHNTTPFRWVWTRVGESAYRLPAGDHYLHVFIHEDGMRLDQFILSPVPIEGGAPYQPNLHPNRNTDFQQSLDTSLDLTFDLKSMVMTPECPPVCQVAIRRLKPATGLVSLDVFLRDAPTSREDGRLAHYEFQLDTLPEVAFVPIDFTDLPLDAMERREYLLVAEARLDGRLIGSARVPLCKPFAWEVCGPFDYYENGVPGPLDAAKNAPPPGGPAWEPLPCDNYDAFAVLDFGLFTTGNSLHADEWKTIYARTRIHVPETADYLFKLQSDDQMLLWLDGRQIYRHDQSAPVTRSVARPTIRLEAGDHTLKMRVNQQGMSNWQDGRWQASLRIRTPADTLSNVTGNRR